MVNLSLEDRRVWGFIGVMVFISLIFIPISQVWLDIEYTYTVRIVALGGAILGMVSGVLGCFAVLRRESLMGDALSHAALPGVTIAFLVAGRDLGVLLIGAGIASWVGVQFIRAVLHTTRLKQDATMGIVLAVWFAFGIAMLAYIQSIPDASQAGLDSFIFGQAAAIIESDVQLISIVGLISFVILGLFWKEFKLITFDPLFAQANGFRVGFINSLLTTLIVVAIVLGLQLAGVILMVGMLIAPAIAARQWTQKLEQMIILSAVMGAFAGGIGAVLSAVDAKVPTGPMIIVVAFTLVIISIGFAPERGLVWTMMRRRNDARRFASLQLLRDVYRYAIAHEPANHPVPDMFLRGVRGNTSQLGLDELLKLSYITQDSDSWQLTASGVERAKNDHHNQQLWDTYRAYNAELDLPLVIEDRQKSIRDMLPSIAIQRLEEKLETLEQEAVPC